MNKFEQQKAKYTDLQVPAVLEQRLHNVLAQQQKKRSKLGKVSLLVAAAMILIFASFNLNTFAYYSKKLFGYEQLMNSTLAQLNEGGAGQAIDKSITMQDGTRVTVEGILSDTNRLIVYYKAKNAEHSLENGIQFNEITGFLTREHFSSGTYELSDDQHTITGMATFDAVNPFAKNLTLSLADKQSKVYTISFRYNAHDALPKTLKKTINETIQTDLGTFTIKKLTSTNASTLITGTFNKTTDRTFNIPMVFVLYADNNAIAIQQSSMSSSLFDNYKIELLFDTIPRDTKKLELKLEQSYTKQKINVTVPLTTEVGDIIGPKNLQILNVVTKDTTTEITIHSQANVIYDDVSLQTVTGKVPLKTTQNSHEGEHGTTRTLVFNSTEEAASLTINNMYALEPQNQTITILN